MSFLSFVCAVLLLTCGLYLTFKSGFFQFLKFKKVLSVTFGKLISERDSDGFKAMAIALGSTIGIGNIIGVAAAICIGGPGAIFWMLMTGFFGMMTKYAEIHVCVSEAKEQHRTCGGPMYVIRTRAKGRLKAVGTVFAVCCVSASLFAGNLIQSKSMFEFAELGFGIGEIPVALFTLPLMYFIISGRDSLYQNFSAAFVPLMSVFYISATLFIIMKNIVYVPGALLTVLKSALGFEEACGGVCGAALSAAVRTGVMKGLFTNEAGLGSSPIAHSSAKKTDPFSQGCWGIVEVFIDTVVVCMLTALAVLSSPVYINGLFSDPFTLVCEIFRDTFGNAGLKALSVSAYCFAFASIVGWSFYGIKAVGFLSDKAVFLKAYIFIYLLCMPVSSLIDNSGIWILTDLFNSFMLIPNAVLLLAIGGKAVGDLKVKEKNSNGLQTLSEKMRRREKCRGK